MSVHDAIAAVMTDLTSLPKEDTNTHQGFRFRGVDAVVNAVGPLLRRYGLVVYPSSVEYVMNEISTGQGRPMNQCVVRVTYRWANSDSHLDVETVGEAFDAGDKATTKAMSVAYRTMFLQTLCLPTGEPDPDSSTYVRDTPDTPKVDTKAKASRRMWAAITSAGMAYGTDADKETVRAWMSDVVGHEIASSKDLTLDEIGMVIDTLKGD